MAVARGARVYVHTLHCGDFTFADIRQTQDIRRKAAKFLWISAENLVIKDKNNPRQHFVDAPTACGYPQA